MNLGVSWTTPEDLIVTTVVARSGSQSISSLDGATIDTLEATLPGGVTAVGGWVNNFDGGFAPGVTLSVFDGSGALLGSGTVLNPAVFTFIGIISTDPIALATFVATSTVPGDDFAVDDFVFGTAADAVPEPATLLLLGAGLAAIARSRMTKRQ